ncbi:MAG: hypothetical protein AAFU68_13970 [Pseudomonadota bacterium]
MLRSVEALKAINRLVYRVDLCEDGAAELQDLITSEDKFLRRFGLYGQCFCRSQRTGEFTGVLDPVGSHIIENAGFIDVRTDNVKSNASIGQEPSAYRATGCEHKIRDHETANGYSKA